MAIGDLTSLLPIAPPIVLVRFLAEAGHKVWIHVRSNCVTVWVEADSMLAANEAKNVVIEALELEPLPEQEDARVDSLERRVDAVQRVQEDSVRLRAFLSFRFGEPDAAVAHDVERFLTLAGVDVSTGQSYEPRRVEDKVRSRLSDVDFVVYLLTSSGDSAWVRDEIAAARAADVGVIPLVENGVEFEQGLFGNVERVPFASGHIGDVWISLMEAVKYVRAEKARAVEAML